MRKHGYPKPPDYYIGPTRRPSIRCTGATSHMEWVWDMTETWVTASEWLAWVRRRDGRPRYWSKGVGCWHYPMRPIISAHRVPWFTRMARRLPK